MHPKRWVSAALGVSGLVGLALLLTVVGPAAAKVGSHAATRVTIVTVTAGKPTELGFKLSKFSGLPAGPITFKVTNMGLGGHDFKICTTPVTSLAKNACLGKVTKLLKHGDTATLTVTLTKGGKYEYLCAVPGHAAAGMKGLLGVGVTVTAAASAAGSTSSSSSTSGGGTTAAGYGGGGGAVGGGAGDPECPAGQTIATQAVLDHDDDDGGGPTDGDGCI